MKAIDKMSPALKVIRFHVKVLKKVTLAAFKAMRFGARLVGRAFKAMLGPIGLITAALGGFGVIKLLKIATTVEDKVREIATLIPDLGGEAIARLSRDIRAAAVEGGQSFEEEFKGAYDAISAGVAPAQLIKFIKTANKLAVGGASDVATAVDLLTGTLNAFSADASEAERFADALFTTVRKGKTTISELAQGIGNVSSIAAAAGLSIEETGAAMAALTLSLGSTDRAATQLKASLSVLVTINDEQRRKAADLADGLDISLEALQKKGIIKFLEEFSKKTQGSLNVIAKFIPNIRAISGLSILAADGGRQFADAMDAMRNNVGEADRAFALMAESAGFAFRQLRAAFADIATEVGGAFLPTLRDLAESVREFLQENREGFREWAESVVRSVTFAVRAIGPLKDLITGLFTDEAEAETLGIILKDLSVFALAVAKETAIAGIKIILEAVKASLRSFLDVAGIFGEQVAARFLGKFRNELKTIATLPAEIVVFLKDKFGDAVGTTLALATPLTRAFASQTRESLDQLKEDIRNTVDAAGSIAESRIISAEDAIGKAIQAVGANIRVALSDQGEALGKAKDNIGIAFDELVAKFAELSKTSPLVKDYLAALNALREEMSGVKEDATAAAVGIDAMGAAIKRAADKREQARRNAAGTAFTAAEPVVKQNTAEEARKLATLLEDANILMLTGRARAEAELLRSYDREIVAKQRSVEGIIDAERVMQQFILARRAQLDRDVAALAEKEQLRVEELVRATGILQVNGRARVEAELIASFEREVAAKRLAVQGIMGAEDLLAEFILARRMQLNRRLEEINGSVLDGIKRGAEEFVDQAGNMFAAGKEAFAAFQGTVTTGLNSAFDAILDGTKSAKEAFKDFARQALTEIGKIIAKLIALKIVKALFGGAGGFAEGGVVGPVVAVKAFAKGGLANLAGPLAEVQRFASGGLTGGIVSKPSLALIGEGKQREAIVPLPDGKTIPAIITDPGGSNADVPPIQNFFTFTVTDARGMKEAIQQQAETIRNIVAQGINQRRDFRGQVRGA